MSSSLISLAFKRCRNEKRPALLTYTVAGDPNKKKALEILKSISEIILCTPSGVAGTNLGLPEASNPKFSLHKPATSFKGEIV